MIRNSEQSDHHHHHRSPDEGENIKKVYKEISEVSRHIDSLSAKCRTIPDLFSSELIDKRARLRDACVNILLEYPKIHGRIVREKLWRHVYYDVICRARRLQRDKEWNGVPLAYISQYLLNGVGHLNIVLMKLAELPEFIESKFPFRPNGLDNILPLETSYQMSNKHSTEPPKWLLDLIYIISINLGDLYRYLTDFYAKWDEDESKVYFNRAKDYYAQAFVLYPDSGLAPNQIGNLSTKLNGGVDSTYYLLHSMLSTVAYEGASSNLQQHLSHVLVKFATLPATKEAKPMEVFCNSFLTQIHNFLYETVNMANFGKNIADLMTNFQERLATYDPDLDESLLFRISSICVLTFWQLQAQNSTNISLAVALATAMFSQLITQLGTILEQHSHLQKEFMRKLSPSPNSLIITQQNGNVDENEVNQIEDLNYKISNIKFDKDDANSVDGSMKKNKSNGHIVETSNNIKRKKKTFLERKRRPRACNNIQMSDDSDEDECRSEGSYNESDNDEKNSDDDDDGHFYTTDEGSDSDDDDEDSEYENEELIDKSSQSDIIPHKHEVHAFNSASSSNCHSDISGNSGHIHNSSKRIISEEPPMLEFESEKNSGCIESNEDVELETTDAPLAERFIIGQDDMQKCWSQLEPVLVAMLPFVRWLQISPEIRDAFSANCGKEYVSKMCDMFNLLSSQNWSKVLDNVDDKLKEDWKLLEQNQPEKDRKLFQYQLPEDRSMLGIPRYQDMLKDFETGLNLNKNGLLVTRIARILLYGHYLVETKSFSMIYDPEEKLFMMTTQKLLERRDRDKKFRKLMDEFHSNPGGDALTKLYKASGETYDQKSRRNGRNRQRHGKDGGGGGRERRRRGRNNNNERNAGRDRSKSSSKIVFVVVDLPAVLYNLDSLKKMANKRRFVVVLPKPVWKTIDEMKETADEARIASEWLEKCSKSGHRGVRCLRDHERSTVDYVYPKFMDQQTSDFFLSMETCAYLVSYYNDSEEQSQRKFFGDFRDKFRVIYLSGYLDLLKPGNNKEFDPIGIARVVGTFVDVVNIYPPAYGRRKWKSIKSNGG